MPTYARDSAETPAQALKRYKTMQTETRQAQLTETRKFALGILAARLELLEDIIATLAPIVKERA